MLVSEGVSRPPKKKVWTEDMDPATIPVEVLVSQLERVPYEAICRYAVARMSRSEPATQAVFTGPNTIRTRSVVDVGSV